MVPGRWQEVRTEKPDLVILDLMMPELDGHEVCRRLRTDVAAAGLPVNLFTSTTQVQPNCVQDGTGHLGIDEYMVRTWLGWHRHVTERVLAHHFLVRTQQWLGRGQEPWRRLRHDCWWLRSCRSSNWIHMRYLMRCLNESGTSRSRITLPICPITNAP